MNKYEYLPGICLLIANIHAIAGNFFLGGVFAASFLVLMFVDINDIIK